MWVLLHCSDRTRCKRGGVLCWEFTQVSTKLQVTKLMSLSWRLLGLAKLLSIYIKKQERVLQNLIIA